MSGIASVGIAVWEAVKKNPIREKTFWAIGGIFLFVAFDQAWQDEHRNTQVVIAEKSAEAGAKNLCLAYAQVGQAYSTGLQNLNHAQTKTINQQSLLFAQQQGAINSCVVSLGKMNPVVNAKVTTLAMMVTKSTQQDKFGFPKAIYLFEIVILTNHTSEPRGVIKCDGPFKVIGSPSLHTQATMAMMASGPPEQISDREYRIWVQNTGAEWDSENPIYLPAVSETENLTGCDFTQGK